MIEDYPGGGTNTGGGVVVVEGLIKCFFRFLILIPEVEASVNPSVGLLTTICLVPVGRPRGGGRHLGVRD